MFSGFIVCCRHPTTQVSGELSEFVHTYVDPSFEPGGYCGVGGVAYAPLGKCLGFVSETVIQELGALGLLLVSRFLQMRLLEKGNGIHGQCCSAWSFPEILVQQSAM